MTPAYQALARKWRPKTFADLVGQEHVVRALQNALAEGRLHHAYLLTGTRGVGKTTIARILAKAFNCTDPQQGEPCGRCASCSAIDQNRFPDLLEIDAASNTGIDNIREVLENAQYAPTAGRYKVYIIDEVHMLSKSAFNAMLKTLEEPPPHVKFILATTDPQKVPVTVLSRCLQFVLRNMTAQQVAAHLAHVLDGEAVVYEAPALALLARAAAGSMRDALSLLDQAIAMGAGAVRENEVRQMLGTGDGRRLFALLDALAARDGAALAAHAAEMAADGTGFDGALSDLAALLLRLSLIQAVPSALPDDDPDCDTLARLAAAFHAEQLQLYYQCAIHGRQDLPLAPDEHGGFLMTLLRMLAFAPFAADAVPEQAQIDGTDFPSEPSETAKTPPAPRMPAADNVPRKQFRPHELPPPRPQEIRRQSAAKVPPAPFQAAAPYDDVPPETLSDDAEDDTPPWDTLPETSAPPTNDTPPPSDAAVKDVLPETDAAAFQAAAPDSELLAQEQWFDTAQRIGTQVAAAQMLLQHLAWVSWADGTLTLAVDREQAADLGWQDDFAGRIAEALSEAAGAAVRVRVCDWHGDEHGETPYQRQTRIQRERRGQARACLENDAAARQLRELFGAAWREESLRWHDAVQAG